MQIDFHHAVTYVVSRLAGFSYDEANIIAYSSQYVDDATNAGKIEFSNGAGYERISSAHKMLDYRNFKELANHQVWVPFHFLPGNGMMPAGENPDGSFIQKLVCRPNSPIAQDVVRSCIDENYRPYALHRLGITMHVYADTWAHQNFAGVCHTVNEVIDLEDNDPNSDGIANRLRNFFGDAFESLQSRTLDSFPLGHGAALTHPDMPFLKWNYHNGLGERIVRDNTRDFLEAIEHMFVAMKRFQAGNSSLEVKEKIGEKDFKQIESNFLQFIDRDGEKREELWIESISKGDFSFGSEYIGYIPKGINSWKYVALEDKDHIQKKDNKYSYSSEFLKSDWKLFHDAIQVHRIRVLRDILPDYGICCA